MAHRQPHLAAELLAAISSVRRSARVGARRPAELSALTGAQLELVRLVRRNPGVSIADAAHALRLAPNTVSTLVRQLSDAGLVVRDVDDADRRVARLDLASEIRGKVDAWRDRRAVAVGGALGALSADERRRLEAALPVLGRLADLLADEAPPE